MVEATRQHFCNGWCNGNQTATMCMTMISSNSGLELKCGNVWQADHDILLENMLLLNVEFESHDSQMQNVNHNQKQILRKHLYNIQCR